MNKDLIEKLKKILDKFVDETDYLFDLSVDKVPVEKAKYLDKLHQEARILLKSEGE